MKLLNTTDSSAKKTRLEQAEARTEQAEARTEQAKTRTEQAETRTEHARTRTESAETRTEKAEIRTEQAETRAEQAETTVENLRHKPVASCAEVPSPSLSTASAETNSDARLLELLTVRQREILQLISHGQNTKHIAHILKVSPKTIEYHRLRLMAVLKMHDIPGLVRFALRVGLVSPES